MACNWCSDKHCVKAHGQEPLDEWGRKVSAVISGLVAERTAIRAELTALRADLDNIRAGFRSVDTYEPEW